jgi:hypothetical protein
MALDGLSNQSVGIYRTKSPSEKVDKMAAKYKEKAEFNLASVEETNTIAKVDADEQKKQNNDDATKELGRKEGNVAFLLPAMEKNELFKTVALDGALPRKTFSMGHSDDKRFYLEARSIK